MLSPIWMEVVLQTRKLKYDFHKSHNEIIHVNVTDRYGTVHQYYITTGTMLFRKRNYGETFTVKAEPTEENFKKFCNACMNPTAIKAQFQKG